LSPSSKSIILFIVWARPSSQAAAIRLYLYLKPSGARL